MNRQLEGVDDETYAVVAEKSLKGTVIKYEELINKKQEEATPSITR